MRLIEHNAVLIIIYIGGVLQVVFARCQRQGDDAVRLPGGSGRIAAKPYIFLAQKALRVATRLNGPRPGNLFRILFRLG